MESQSVVTLSELATPETIDHGPLIQQALDVVAGPLRLANGEYVWDGAVSKYWPRQAMRKIQLEAGHTVFHTNEPIVAMNHMELTGHGRVSYVQNRRGGGTTPVAPMKAIFELISCFRSRLSGMSIDCWWDESTGIPVVDYGIYVHINRFICLQPSSQNEIDDVVVSGRWKRAAIKFCSDEREPELYRQEDCSTLNDIWISGQNYSHPNPDSNEAWCQRGVEVGTGFFTNSLNFKLNLHTVVGCRYGIHINTTNATVWAHTVQSNVCDLYVNLGLNGHLKAGGWRSEGSWMLCNGSSIGANGQTAELSDITHGMENVKLHTWPHKHWIVATWGPAGGVTFSNIRFEQHPTSRATVVAATETTIEVEGDPFDPAVLLRGESRLTALVGEDAYLAHGDWEQQQQFKIQSARYVGENIELTVAGRLRYVPEPGQALYVADRRPMLAFGFNGDQHQRLQVKMQNIVFPGPPHEHIIPSVVATVDIEQWTETNPFDNTIRRVWKKVHFSNKKGWTYDEGSDAFGFVGQLPDARMVKVVDGAVSFSNVEMGTSRVAALGQTPTPYVDYPWGGGTREYTYWLVARDGAGRRAKVSAPCIVRGPEILTVKTPARFYLNWTRRVPAIGYDVYRDTKEHPIATNVHYSDFPYWLDTGHALLLNGPPAPEVDETGDLFVDRDLLVRGNLWITGTTNIDRPDQLPRVVTTSGTLLPHEIIVLVDASAGDVDLTLPDPQTIPGHQYYIKKIDSTRRRVQVAEWRLPLPIWYLTSVQSDAIHVVSIGTRWVRL